jgi:hypothetical protein
MFLAKKHLSRRTLLRGLALPFLDAMAPAQTRLEAPRSRLACIEMVHGSAGSTDEGVSKHYWSPKGEGPLFQFSYSLEPLAALREYITIVSGTDARQAEALAPSEGGADHFRSSAVFLTAAHPKQGSDIRNGVSIDQLYAQRQDTRLPSIQLCIENIGLSGSCGFDYSCIYSETISWASPTEPLPMEVNPRIAFEKLFGAVAGGSVLDGIAEDRARLKNSLGAGDRVRVDSYFDDVRGIERRIQAIEKQNALAPVRALAAAPLGVPDSWEKHVELMFDIQVLAFAADITRVSAFKMSRDTSNRLFPESGVKAPFHTLSHHSGRSNEIAEFAKLNRYHVGLVARFLEKLKATPDGDGNLLDHSLVLYGSPMGDSNTHNHKRLPVFLAGHACGAMKGSLHSVCTPGTPHANTLLTILRKLGVEAESVGDSTGEILV